MSDFLKEGKAMKIKYPFIYLLLIGAFLMITQGCSEEEQTELLINGTVTKAEDGSPLPGALVELRKKGWYTSELLTSDLTDSKGQYTISYIEEGYCPESLLFLRASKYGYQYSDSGSTRLRCINRLQTINFQLKKAK